MNRPMKKQRLVVTAGPTREHLDPVRFLSNPSTGKMGFAIAKAAVEAGYEVVLVAGPVALKTPKDVKRVDVVSAREMEKAVASAAGDILIATAAVADWRPAHCSMRKLKKGEMGGTLALVRNPDILKGSTIPLKIGFAAETGDPVAEALRKCREKKLAFCVANDVTQKDAGFGVSTNCVIFVKPDGSCTKLPKLSKLSVARRIIAEIGK